MNSRVVALQRSSLAHGRPLFLGVVTFLLCCSCFSRAEDTAPSPDLFDFWNWDNPRGTPSGWSTLRGPLFQQAPPSGSSEEALSRLLARDDGFVHALRDYSDLRSVPGAMAPTMPGGTLTGIAGRMKVSQKTEIDVARLQTRLELPDPHELRQIPYLARDWHADESVNVPIPIALPVAEAMFVFGQVGSGGDYLNNQQTRVSGRTGIGWKWAPFSGSEFQIRGGPGVEYEDFSVPRPLERTFLSIEVQAKVPLYGPVHLQYRGEAIPAMQNTERDLVNQDLKLALPLGSGNELHLGARYRWEYTTSQVPWVDRTELYLGIQFNR